MDDARNQISDLYHRALERAPEERVAFLADACKGDPRLQREIESLLAYQPEADSFLESPPRLAAGAVPGAGTTMLNRAFGVHTIVAPLGAGGMGEVYRARDSRLRRDVAIKILPPHFTDNPERRARFEREARVLAALNHPNIGAIYALQGGPRAARVSRAGRSGPDSRPRGAMPQ